MEIEVLVQPGLPAGTAADGVRREPADPVRWSACTVNDRSWAPGSHTFRAHAIVRNCRFSGISRDGHRL